MNAYRSSFVNSKAQFVAFEIDRLECSIPKVFSKIKKRKENFSSEKKKNKKDVIKICFTLDS